MINLCEGLYIYIELKFNCRNSKKRLPPIYDTFHLLQLKCVVNTRSTENIEFHKYISNESKI